MKCAYHYDQDAVAQCVDCGVFLCPECAERYTPIVCVSCAAARVKAVKAAAVRTIVVSIIMGLVGGFLGYAGTHNLIMMLAFFLLFAGLPWGWGFLNRITPTVFLFIPLLGWLIYGIIKFTLSLVVGIFAMPFKIGGAIKDIKSANAVEL